MLVWPLLVWPLAYISVCPACWPFWRNAQKMASGHLLFRSLIERFRCTYAHTYVHTYVPSSSRISTVVVSMAPSFTSTRGRGVLGRDSSTVNCSTGSTIWSSLMLTVTVFSVSLPENCSTSLNSSKSAVRKKNYGPSTDYIIIGGGGGRGYFRTKSTIACMEWTQRCSFCRSGIYFLMELTLAGEI